MYDQKNMQDDGAESVASGAIDDDASAFHDVSSVTNKDYERKTLARREDLAVQWMRGAVFLVLLGTAALVASGVYVVVWRDQVKDFEDAFEADCKKVLDTFNKAVERRLEAIDALSLSITAFARDTKSTFPNVTVSDFEVRCANSRVLADTPMIHYHPIVTDETRNGWEAYQIANRDRNFDSAFVSDVSMIEQQNIMLSNRSSDRKLQAPPVVLNDEISFRTYNGSIAAAPRGSGPYLPIWQISPVIPVKSLLNHDMLSNPVSRGSYLETMRTGQAVIDVASNLNGENLSKAGALWKLMLGMSQYRNDVEEFLGEPISAVGYPVFDSFDISNRTIVGVLGTSMYWSQYFKNILPDNTKGIICVLTNSEGQAFTFEIGETVKYQGAGDLHDPKYTHMGQYSVMSAHIASISSPESKSYTSVKLNSEHCDYKLWVYPSQANEDVYVNNEPVLLMVIILCVFGFTSIIFVLYTIAVSRRQVVVMNRAVTSSAIVSSLFPSQVRDQIYQENETGGGGGGKVNVWKRESQNDLTESATTGRPIAQLFENTTIMFADMAGFTQWSSKRQPVQVFELLETVYQAFDAIAIRRKVFKVETIGDCYVAVAGLPEPQDDHAVIMAKFADACMTRMGQLTTELSESLGPDTAELTLRVGLHSGNVTGGVLRGQKSRFQLFGDTMNTASRMESNGEAGRIHASHETMMELGAKGKSSWVSPREDMIVAKGKGQLQTYWVTPRLMAGSVVSVRTHGTTSDDEEGEVDKHTVESVEL